MEKSPFQPPKLASYLWPLCQVAGVSDGLVVAKTWRIASPYAQRILTPSSSLGAPLRLQAGLSRSLGVKLPWQNGYITTE